MFRSVTNRTYLCEMTSSSVALLGYFTRPEPRRALLRLIGQGLALIDSRQVVEDTLDRIWHAIDHSVEVRTHRTATLLSLCYLGCVRLDSCENKINFCF